MVYVKHIKVDKYDDFVNMAFEKKFTISQTIVEAILDNLQTSKKEIPVFEIEVGDSENIYTLSVQTDEFVQTLETNLIHYENEEAYEGCQKIIEAINYLKQKKNG